MIRLKTLACCLCFGALLSAQNGVVIGNSQASGENAFATGDSSLAEGYAAIAAGSFAKALGDFSLSLGDRTTAEGKWSQALGFGTHTLGEYSLGAGFFNFTDLSAPFGLAIGAANIVRNAGGIAIGRDNISQGDAALVLGTWSRAHTYGEIVLGAYADTAYTPSTTISSEWHPTDRLFSIANGNGDGAGNGRYSNALTMLKNGDTDMIGNLNVQKSLTVGEDTTQVLFEEGQIRYNGARQDLEGYVQSQWFSLTDVNKPRSEVGSWELITDVEGNLKSSGPAVRQFLKIGDIKGAVTAENFEDQTEISNLRWEVNRSILEGAKRGQRSKGVTSLNRMTLVMLSDRSAPKLLEASLDGTLFFSAEITVVSQNFNGSLQTRLKYTLKDVIITSADFFMDTAFNEERFRIVLDFTEVEGFAVKINPQTGQSSGQSTFKFPDSSN